MTRDLVTTAAPTRPTSTAHLAVDDHRDGAVSRCGSCLGVECISCRLTCTFQFDTQAIIQSNESTHRRTAAQSVINARMKHRPTRLYDISAAHIQRACVVSVSSGGHAKMRRRARRLACTSVRHSGRLMRHTERRYQSFQFFRLELWRGEAREGGGVVRVGQRS